LGKKKGGFFLGGGGEARKISELWAELIAFFAVAPYHATEQLLVLQKSVQ